ncbi:uncharacterized protein LOC100210508 [Hydra vulgaris]|uniref:uncharacterized protein LOC100210508 n=1 Tax=Hydra vulgaris TaxID=6087 RepID=UPI0032EA6C1B
MLQEGGRDSNDLCERLLNLLLSIDLAKQLNRSGKNGKLKLPVKLEKFIKDCVLTKFPNETRNVVELRIKRFLHNAKDKNGGRAARRNSKVPKEAVECNDLIIAKNNKDFDNEHPGPKCQMLLFLDSLPSNEAVRLTINRRTPSGAVECKEVNNDQDTNDFGSAHPDSNCPNAAHSELSVKNKTLEFHPIQFI